MLRDGCLTAFNCFNEAIILLIKPIEIKYDKLSVTQWLTDGCQCISIELDLIVERMCGHVTFLYMSKFIVNL
jgi:hypothetical protein